MFRWEGLTGRKHLDREAGRALASSYAPPTSPRKRIPLPLAAEKRLTLLAASPKLGAARLVFADRAPVNSRGIAVMFRSIVALSARRARERAARDGPGHQDDIKS